MTINVRRHISTAINQIVVDRNALDNDKRNTCGNFEWELLSALYCIRKKNTGDSFDLKKSMIFIQTNRFSWSKFWFFSISNSDSPIYTKELAQFHSLFSKWVKDFRKDSWEKYFVLNASRCGFKAIQNKNMHIRMVFGMIQCKLHGFGQMLCTHFEAK